MSPIPLPTDDRLDRLRRWLHEGLGLRQGQLSVASADASFRRYFRWCPTAGDSLIVMDAPPEHESLDAYLQVTELLRGAGVHAPQLHEVDIEQGFILLEDLGSTPYLSVLREPGRAPALYAAAQLALARMQLRLPVSTLTLPAYDAPLLQREMELMPQWFCQQHLGLKLTTEEREFLTLTFTQLIESALEQPKVFVHRDYHSRNLMLLPQQGPGVIDYQDAVTGPVTYDLVSLLKDCYIRWPRESVERWVRDYHRLLRAQGRADLAGSSADFLCWFDFMGVQRHLKVLGIFARLHWRDGKSGYLADLPLTLEYLQETCARYAALQPLAKWLDSRIAPQLTAANAAALSATQGRPE